MRCDAPDAFDPAEALDTVEHGAETGLARLGRGFEEAWRVIPFRQDLSRTEAALMTQALSRTKLT